MKTLLTFIATLFAFTAFAQGPVLRTPYTVNTADVVTNIVRNIGTNSTIHAGKLAPGGTLPALNGSALTSLNGTAIASGTVADARLSANIPKKDAVNVFSASNYISAGMFGDLTVQNNIVGQGNISLNGLLGDPNFATVSLDTSTGDLLTAGSIYLTSGAEMIFGNGGGLSNLPSASLVGALPAIDGSQLTGITGGSGISPTGTVSVSSIPLITSSSPTARAVTNLLTFSDGTVVDVHRLNIIILTDSIGWQSSSNLNWPRWMTNEPALKGTKAVLNLGMTGLGMVAGTNAWHTNALPWITNNVDASDMNLVLFACGRNDASVNGTLSTNGVGYINIVSNFGVAQVKARGPQWRFGVVSIMSDSIFGNMPARHMYRQWAATDTNSVDVFLDFAAVLGNNYNSNYFVLNDPDVGTLDATHTTIRGAQVLGKAAVEFIRNGSPRGTINGTTREGTNIVMRSDLDGSAVWTLTDNSSQTPLQTGPWTTAANPNIAGRVMAANASNTGFLIQSPPDQLAGDHQTLTRWAGPAGTVGSFDSDGDFFSAGSATHNGPLILHNNTGQIDWLFNQAANQTMTISAGGVTNVLLSTNGSVTIPTGGFTVSAGRITNNGIVWIVGAGSPEGVDVAGIGSIKSRTDGSTDTALYRKETGTGNTGWVAVSAGSGSGGGLPGTNEIIAYGSAFQTNAARMTATGLSVSNAVGNIIIGGTVAWGDYLNITNTQGGLSIMGARVEPHYFGALNLPDGLTFSPNSTLINNASGSLLFQGGGVNGMRLNGTDLKLIVPVAWPTIGGAVSAAGATFISPYQDGIVGVSGLFSTNGLRVSSGGMTNATVLWGTGTGSPEGAVVAPIGSIWSRTDGSTDTALYRKETGTGNTGWVAVSAGAGGGTTNVVNDGNSVVVTDPDGTTRLDALAASTKINNDAGTTILEGQSSGNGDTTIGSHGGTAQIGLSDAAGGTITLTGNMSIDEITATTITGSTSTIRTNSAQFDVDITAFVIGTRYTNSTRRSFVTASFTLNGAAAGTAAVTLSAEQAGVTNMVKISAGPLASLSTIEQLSLLVGPGAFYYFTDATTGTGASVAIVTGTSSRTDW